MELRAKKFGAQSENVKKDLRAQRFGISNSAKAETTNPDGSKLDKRAQRFGTQPNTPVKVDPELLEKRAKRFGIDATSPSSTPSNDKVKLILLTSKLTIQ